MTGFPLSVRHIHVRELYRAVQPEENIGSGRFLMGRTVVGVPIRYRIEEAVTHVTGPTTFVLDFGGIEDISASVADELGPILYDSVVRRNHPRFDPHVVYADMCEDVRLGLNDEFMRAEQAAVSISLDPVDQLSPQTFILGPSIPTPILDVVHHCYLRGAITSSDLTDVKLAAASKKFTEIFDKYPGLLYRCKVYGTAGPRSWQYVYYPLVPTGYRGSNLDAEADALGA